MIKNIIIHEYLKQRQSSRFWTEKIYMHHNLEDEMMINIRNYEQLSLLQLNIQSVMIQFSEIKLYMKDVNDHLVHIHHIIYNLFMTSVTKKIIIATFISTAQNDQFLAQWEVFQCFCAWKHVFSSTDFWFDHFISSKHTIQKDQIMIRENHFIVNLSYHCTYCDDHECWLYEDVDVVQANKVQKIVVFEFWALNCKLRVLITTTDDNREYLDFIKLSKHFEYQFKVENHFKIQIEIEIWTVTIISTSFIFASTMNIMIALHCSHINNEWSTLKLKFTLDFRFMLKKTNHKRIQEYCFKDSSIIIQVNAVRSDTTFKIQLAAIKKLNSTHINEKKLIHNFKWRDILIDQDLHTKKEINIFKDNDIKAKLNAWSIFFNEEQMKILQYCCTLSNSFNLIKDVFKLSKMFMNVVITLLLISIDQKVKVLSSFNCAADAFIIKLHEQLEVLCRKRLDIMNQHCVYYHIFSTKHKVLAYENLKHTTQKSYFDQIHWTEITLLLNMIYDFMIHHLIEKSRIWSHEIHDHRYQVHNVSMSTLLVRLCKFDKCQSSSFENSNC